MVYYLTTTDNGARFIHKKMEVVLLFTYQDVKLQVIKMKLTKKQIKYIEDQGSLSI